MIANHVYTMQRGLELSEACCDPPTSFHAVYFFNTAVFLNSFIYLKEKDVGSMWIYQFTSSTSICVPTCPHKILGVRI